MRGMRRRPPMRLRRLRLRLFGLLGTLLVVDWCGVDLCLLTVRAVLFGSILPLLDCTPFRRRSTDTGFAGRALGRMRPALHCPCSPSCPYGHPRAGRAQSGGARY